MTDITNLEPELLWKHFEEIRKVPRASKHEERIREYITNFAIGHNLVYKSDKVGNIVISKPATSGLESKPTVVLQSHMDMVCEKNADKAHDFSKDPLSFKMDGDWLKADGTTLGADNGIGLCASLAILESGDVKHGPIEALFTIDEETGLTGAFALSNDMLKGRLMLNLDSEELGAIYVGCAGGGDSSIRLPLKREAPEGSPVRVAVKGLRGGHSGVDIHEQRGNAIKLLARLLWDSATRHDFALADIKGGNLRNAIPREAEAVVFAANPDPMMNDLMTEANAIQAELQKVDPDFRLEVSALKPGEAPKAVLDAGSSLKVIGLLNGLPHGVLAMSLDIPGLVETSCNLAVVGIEPAQGGTGDGSGGEVLKVQMSSRSSIGTRLRQSRDTIKSIAVMTGADVQEGDAYPGWKPNLDSPLLKTVAGVYQNMLGKEPARKAIHAGLETGVIGERFPGMDMVSIGPDIKYPHSPDERVSIPSVATFYKAVLKVLESV